MSKKKKRNLKKENNIMKYLVTAALPYTNNLPHVGHLAGSHLPADIFNKFLKLFGFESYFVGGTDEHGSPIEVAAFKENKSPKELCDYYYVLHKKIYDWLRIDYDIFSRTSSKENWEITQEIFKKIYEKGYIIEKTIKMSYCEKDKKFLPDRWVEGICPYCKYEKARGDQCENCGRLLDPIDLIDAKCIICGSKVVFKDTKHLFFDLPKFSKKLEKWLKKKKYWKENVLNYSFGFLKEGLKERAITRDLSWGIKVPLKGYEDKVFYVWFDAPIGYISFSKQLFEKIGKKDLFEYFWIKKKGRIYHFLGKDNIVFHTIWWPSILLAADLALPYNVCGLEYLNFEGKKISKSQNWGVFFEIVNNEIKIRIKEKIYDVNPDYLRFYLSFILPETKDSSFSLKEFQDKINNVLIANFGNFVYRVLSFVKNNFDYKIPKAKLSKEEKEILKKIKQEKKEIKNLVFSLKFRKALEKIVEISSLGNEYFQKNEPWKADLETKKRITMFSANLVKDLAILFWPFIPNSCEKIFEMLNLEKNFFGKFKNVGKIELKDHIISREVEMLFTPLELI